ncbi:hypothetical protein PFISCL1PPCAC_11922, partial [Pristionchus fissidentatus]
RIRDLSIMNFEARRVQHFSQFKQILNIIQYQSLSTAFNIGENQHISLLSALLHNRDISDAKLTLKWRGVFDEQKMRFLKEWLLKMPTTKSLRIDCEDFSPTNLVDPSLDDELLYHLARNTTKLDLFMLSSAYTTQGITSIWELFHGSDLREVRLSTSTTVAEQLEVLYNNYNNICITI